MVFLMITMTMMIKTTMMITCMMLMMTIMFLMMTMAIMMTMVTMKPGQVDMRVRPSHVLRPLHFIWWMKANYKPSTHQELCYLNFDLTNWVHKNDNISETISAIRSAQVAKWPQRHPLQYLWRWKGWKSTLSPSFVTFSEREPLFEGLLCWDFWGFLWTFFKAIYYTWNLVFQFYDTGVRK